MHPEKIKVDKIQNGRLSAIIHLDRPDIVEYHENRSRYLHHYYKLNCNSTMKLVYFLTMKKKSNDFFTKIRNYK